MKRVYIFLIILINFILQTSLYNFVEIFGEIPNISLILVVIFAINSNEIEGSIIGIVTGLLYDIMVMNVIGINTLIYFVVGIAFGYIGDELNKENTITYVFMTFLASIVWQILMCIILFFLRTNTISTGSIFVQMFIQIVLNTVLAGLIYNLVVFIFNKLNVKLINR